MIEYSCSHRMIGLVNAPNIVNGIIAPTQHAVAITNFLHDFFNKHRISKVINNTGILNIKQIIKIAQTLLISYLHLFFLKVKIVTPTNHNTHSTPKIGLMRNSIMPSSIAGINPNNAPIIGLPPISRWVRECSPHFPCHTCNFHDKYLRCSIWSE